MSIIEIRSQDRTAKRRKLSHGSVEDAFSSGAKREVSSSDDSDGSTGKGVRPAPLARKSQSLSTTTTSKSSVLPAGGLSKSSVLALQAAELVAEITPKYDVHISKFRPTIEKLESIIKDMADFPPRRHADAEGNLRQQGVAIPFRRPRHQTEVNYKFEYRSPQTFLLQGGLPQQRGIKGDALVEIVAIMPETLFQEKDYLNHRAFHKRAFYLACIAAGIKQQAGDEFDLSYSFDDDVELFPQLTISPKSRSLSDMQASRYQYRLSVGFPSAAIPIEKTLPLKNCIRHPSMEKPSPPQPSEPSPFYNSCIRFAASYQLRDDLVMNTMKKCAAFADACKLAQVWLQQRGFSSSTTSGGFGASEWAFMCALLLHGGGPRGRPLFSDRYSSLQLFKAMLQVLSGRDFRDPMILNHSDLDLSRSDVPIVFDGTTGVNVLFKMTPWSYQRLRRHAQLSLAAVNGRNQDNFDPTFILRVDEKLLEYDEAFSITVPRAALETAKDQRRYLENMYSTMLRGLGDRITLLDIKAFPRETWVLSKAGPSDRQDVKFEIALLTNSDALARLVDHGPSADDEAEAAEYRKFWGEKSELRRFKDGTISESLVWSADTPVTLQVIQYLAMLHFQLPASAIRLQSFDLASHTLQDGTSITTEDAFNVIHSTYQTLASTLHQLDGLPLPVRSVSPADRALRSSAIDHPLLPSRSRPIDIVIQFDSSGRWPDALPAIQHTKIAFLLKLADLLASKNSALTTRVGLENTTSANTGYSNTAYLDIIYPSPAPALSPVCFRTRIHHEREAHLLQTALADKSLHGSVRDSLASALATHKRSFLANPIHTTTIRALCSRFSPFSSTVRLLKKWVSSHLLLRHVPEELLEIVAAHIFLQPAPWSAPGSATTAFLRCLHLLSRWDWAFSPMIVDLSLSQDMTESQIAEIQTRFQAWRKLDPSMNNVVWCVGTNIDPTGTVWTQGATPPRVVAGRITALARAAIEMVKNKAGTMDETDWRNLFTTPLGDFDFQIHLKTTVVRGAKGKKHDATGAAKFKNLQLQEELDVENIGYDPAELFLQDLEHSFGNAALFFYDPDGGRVIAGLWRPTVLGKKEWRVRQGYSSLPLAPDSDEKAQGKTLCEINKNGILAEIAVLGDGLVRHLSSKE